MSNSQAFEIKSNNGHFELKNPSTSPSLCFFFLSSTINLYFPIPDDSVVSPLSTPFILYPFNFLTARRRDAARYGPRPSYSTRRSTREVHPEDLIGRKGEGEKEKREREIFMPKWSAGSRDGTPSESEQAVLLHTGGRPRATRCRTPTRIPVRTPGHEKKTRLPLTIFFSSTPSRRTLITFLSEITLRGKRGASPLTLTALAVRGVGWRMRNIVGVKGGREKGMRFLLSFFLFSSLPLSLFLFRERSSEKIVRQRTGPVSLYPYPPFPATTRALITKC